MSRPKSEFVNLVKSCCDKSPIPVEICEINEEKRTIVVHFENDDLIIANERKPIFRTMTLSYFRMLFQDKQRKPSWFINLIEER